MDQEHAAHPANDREDGQRREYFHAVGDEAMQRCHHQPSLFKIFRPEKDPGNVDEIEGEQAEAKFHRHIIEPHTAAKYFL